MVEQVYKEKSRIEEINAGQGVGVWSVTASYYLCCTVTPTIAQSISAGNAVDGINIWGC